jgi:hypothetical protein
MDSLTIDLVQILYEYLRDPIQACRVEAAAFLERRPFLVILCDLAPIILEDSIRYWQFPEMRRVLTACGEANRIMRGL